MVSAFYFSIEKFMNMHDYKVSLILNILTTYEIRRPFACHQANIDFSSLYYFISQFTCTCYHTCFSLSLCLYMRTIILINYALYVIDV